MKLSKDEADAKKKAFGLERSRRVVDFRTLPPGATVPLSADTTSTRSASSELRKHDLNKSFLSAWLAANLSANAVNSMIDWLRSYVTDGHLLCRRSWLVEHYLPLVRNDQVSAVKEHISAEKSDGLSLMIDGTTDPVHDQKPLNILVATSSSLYFCDTVFFDPLHSENADNLLKLVRGFVARGASRLRALDSHRPRRENDTPLQVADSSRRFAPKCNLAGLPCPRCQPHRSGVRKCVVQGQNSSTHHRRANTW